MVIIADYHNQQAPRIYRVPDSERWVVDYTNKLGRRDRQLFKSRQAAVEFFNEKAQEVTA